MNFENSVQYGIFIRKIPDFDLEFPERWNAWRSQWEAFKSAKRRKEWLFSRLCVAELCNMEFPIEKNAFGAPTYLQLAETHISISHSKTHIGISIQKSVCSIDVQDVTDLAFRISSKFTVQSELKYIQQKVDSNILAANVIWSVKEAVYKYVQSYKLRYIEHIQIQTILNSGSDFKVEGVYFTTEWHEFSCQVQIVDSMIISSITAKEYV